MKLTGTYNLRHEEVKFPLCMMKTLYSTDYGHKLYSVMSTLFFNSICLLFYSYLPFFKVFSFCEYFLSWKHLSALAGRWSQIPFGHSTEVNCLCCGGCGHSLDVLWASGQPVAHRDGLLRTSLCRQLTPFPRVPQSQRPSESISANTQGGEAGKMFRFILGSQTLAAKQLLEMKVNACGFNQ